MEELQSWAAEKRSAYLYRILAKKESGLAYEKLFLRLGEEAEKQALIWESKIIATGSHVPDVLPLDLRTRLVAMLINKLGPKQIRTILAATKVRGLSVYSHALPGHATPTSMEEIGRRHTGSAAGGNLRAAVFGINDGLVSNTALIFGMAGAGSGDERVLVIAGVAGLLAGAFSMAAGEYISVRSQREMFEYQIGLEAEELRLYPEEEAAELALIFQARGLEQDEAVKLSNKLIQDPNKALDTLAREELGLDPQSLGSPKQAAIFSFAAFALGAMVPLLPFLCTSTQTALPIAMGASGLSLFVVGALLSLFTGKGALRGGLRMLLVGASAGCITYAIGRLLGVALG
jgi:VIT1/CCC1 family predicted Fe2+/Mn2+ transporter